jgi:type II secretory pathway component PulF
MEVTSQPEFLDSLLPAIGGLLLFVAVNVLIASGIIYLVYFVLTLPMRRRERARLFLDLVEFGLNNGRAPGLAIQDASASHDRALGVRFHLLAAYLEQGFGLTQALEKVPRLFPPQVVATLKVGERIGDLRKVLPACRLLLRDGVSKVRGAMNYLVMLVFIATPFAVFVSFVLRLKVIPSYRQIITEMVSDRQLPPFTEFVFGAHWFFVLLQGFILLFVWGALALYIGGPRWHALLGSSLGEFLSPWHKRRLQRDFSAMLALLLEAGVPEADAVQLAGESTASPTFVNRARAIIARLKAGEKLPDALQTLDPGGELGWRMTNALRRGRNFLQALSGWHAALDAKAFQLEQAAAQVTTTGLVLLNGAIVGAIVIAVFLGLIKILNEAALW